MSILMWALIGALNGASLLWLPKPDRYWQILAAIAQLTLTCALVAYLSKKGWLG
jgi:hypothetical protein